MLERRLVQMIPAALLCLVLSVPRPPLAQGLDEATALTQQVIQLNNQGRFSEAIPTARRALTIREKALGPNHPDVAASLKNLAELYEAQGHYADAEPLYKRSLAIREKALGPDHPDVATALNNLAGLISSPRSLRRRRATVQAVVGYKREGTWS
jgi:tetratricopeptide (TPR) repeat protein